MNLEIKVLFFKKNAKIIYINFILIFYFKMDKKIILNNKNISYNIKYSNKIVNSKITINRNARVVVTIPFLKGEDYAKKILFEKADWVIRNFKKIKSFQDKVILKNDKITYKKNKEKARELIEKSVIRYNRIYNFKFNRIFIRNQKRRWGSCSRNGNLNFNFKLLFLPKCLLNYVVVHELCHLKEFNHSCRFWSLVEVSIPNYKELREELKKYI